MTQEIINIGTLPNDGTGDPLRVAYGKINNNFTTLYSTSTYTTISYTSGTTPDQIIWEKPVTEFTQASLQIRTSNTSTNDSQGIMIAAHITNDLANVKWTGYATTFEGTPLTNYDMNVSDGNVKLVVTPLVNVLLQHFTASTVTYIDPSETSLLIQLDGGQGSMGTEDGNNIVTE